MSKMKQDKTRMTGEMISGESLTESEAAQGQAGSKFIQWLDARLDRLYQNRWEADPPKEIAREVWGMPPIAQMLPWASDLSTDNIHSQENYFLHYFQSQRDGPTPNECVTTSALMCMNMVKDWAAVQQGQRFEPDRNIAEYTSELDALGLRGWRYRFSTKSPLPGMMTPWQAITALKDFSKGLHEKYGKSLKVTLSARHNLLDLIKQLRAGSIILIHGAWPMTLDRSKKQLGYNPLLAFLGGTPHTMLLIGYDGNTSQWLLLNPADPRPEKKMGWRGRNFTK